MGTLFNDKFISGLKPKDKDYYIKEEQAGRGGGRFAVKVSTNGHKDFYIMYFKEGKAKKLKLGRYGKKIHGLMTLAEAREKFGEYSKQVFERLDPKELKTKKELALKLEEEKKALQGSISQLVQFYIEHQEQSRSEGHTREIKRALEKDFLPFIDPTIKANEIRSDDILKILAPISSRGSNSYHNKLRTYLSGLFNFGMKFDYTSSHIQKKTKFFIEFNPVTKTHPIKGTNKPNTRYLSEEEVKQFWKLLDHSNIDLSKKSIYKIMLLLGTRVKETAEGRWEEINFTDKTWHIPASRTKNHNPNLLPLPDTVIKLLQDIRSYEIDSCFIFCSFETNAPFKIDSINQSLTRLVIQSGMKPFSPKDLRTTFKTLTGKAGLSKDIRDRIQNHALNDVSSVHYDFYDYLPEKRAALEKWEKYFFNIIGDKS